MMQLGRLLAKSFVIVLVIASSCRSSVEPAELCDETVDLVVGSGSTPTFSWTSGCTLGYVGVARIEPSRRTQLWFAFDPGNTLKSGIRYGSQGTSGLSLEAGSEYRVTIGVVIGGDAAMPVGTRDFSR